MKSLANSIFLHLLLALLVDDPSEGFLTRDGQFCRTNESVQGNTTHLIKSQIQKNNGGKYQKIKLSAHSWRRIFEMVTEVVWNGKRKRDTKEGGPLKRAKRRDVGQYSQKGVEEKPNTHLQH